MVPTIGFIGLGEMGSGMAANIIKAGYPLFVFDIDKMAVKKLEALGARIAGDFACLAEQCDWIILSLPDTLIVEKTLFDSSGLAQYLSPGQIVMDCGTTHPLATKDFYERLFRKGIIFLDTPVSGMAKRAEEGTLTVMVGSSRAIFRKVKPVLTSISKNIVYMGGPGSGQLAKLINNVFFNISCATVAELLPLAVKMGLDPEKIVEVAGTGTGQSFALNFFGPLILERNFQPGYPMEKAYKDINAIIEVMSKYQISVPVTMAAVFTYQMALNQGLGHENKGAMVKVWEKVLDVEVKKGKKEK